MKNHWQRMVFLFLFLGMNTMLARANEPRISDVRYWLSQNQAELVIEFSGPFQVEPVKSLPHGTRYIDILEASFKPRRKTFLIEDEYYKKVELVEKKDRVRVYFDIADSRSEVSCQEERLSATHPHRLFIRVKSGRSKTDQWVKTLQRQGEEVRNKGGYLIVIDPGHGGDDPGATKGGLVEKDLNMFVAGEIQRLASKLKNVSVVVTRTEDMIVPLEERFRMAEHYGAHAFISVHFNSNPDRRVNGIEIYHLSQRGAWYAASEKTLEIESHNARNKIFEKDSEKIFQEVLQAQARQLFLSKQLGNYLSAEFEGFEFVKNRGLKFSGLAVLRSLKVPSVLVEVCYLTHPADLEVARDEEKLKRVAASILLGAVNYLKVSRGLEGLDSEYLDFCGRRERTRGIIQFTRVDVGDTMAGIAVKNGVTEKELLEYNFLPEDHFLNEGAIIRIPDRYALKRFKEDQKKEQREKASFAYTVRKGDSLAGIAQKFRLKRMDIVALNPPVQNWSKLTTGMKLTIPGRVAARSTSAANPTPKTTKKVIPAGIEAKGTNWESYLVRQGDTLSEIAQRFKTTTRNLLGKNNLQSIHKLAAGRKILVPSAESGVEKGN